MRDRENIEKGFRQGIEHGIYSMVSTLKDLGIPEDMIIKKLQEKFNLTPEQGQNYLREK